MSTINYNKQLLLAGVFFTLHNTEEAIGFSAFVYPSNLPLTMPAPTGRSMIIAIGLITVIAWALILGANAQQKEINQKKLLIALGSVFLVNAFFPHITATIVLRRYFPAVITSIILYLPYSLWILPKLYRSYPGHNLFYQTAITGLILGTGLVLILQFFVHILL